MPQYTEQKILLHMFLYVEFIFAFFYSKSISFSVLLLYYLTILKQSMFLYVQFIFFNVHLFFNASSTLQVALFVLTSLFHPHHIVSSINRAL
jgi:hypothetical protein